jgi:hypothetical protein
VAGHKPSLRARLAHHPQLADAGRPPATLLDEEHWHHSALARHRGVQILDVRDPALDLHENERPMLRLPSDQVDRSSIAEMVERELDEDLPTVAAHDRGDGVNDGRVLLVEKAGKLTAAPQRLDLDANLESSTDRPQGAQREPFKVPRLRLRHDLLAHAGSHCHIPLPPPVPAAHGAKDKADPQIVHQQILHHDPYQRLSCGLASAG